MNYIVIEVSGGEQLDMQRKEVWNPMADLWERGFLYCSPTSFPAKM